MAMYTLFSGKCPNCQQAGVYAGIYAIKDKCDHCGAVFMRDPGAWTGATVVAYMVGSVWAVGLLAVLWATGQLKMGTGVNWLVSGSTIVVILLCYRFIKGFWVGLLFDWGYVYPDPDPEPEAG